MDNSFVISILLCSINFLLLLTVISLIAKISKIEKRMENAEKNILVFSKKKNIDFEKDMKCLENSIENNLNYFMNNLLPSILNKQNGGFLKKSDIEEIITSVSYNILEELSNDYIKVIEYYIGDINKYVAKRVNEKLIPYTVKHNVHKLT